MRTSSICEDTSRAASLAVRDWFRGETGRALLEAETTLLRRLAEGLFGYYLVDVQGVRPPEALLPDCAVRRKLRIDLLEAPPPDVVARGEQLPLRTDSVDVVVLQHTLDFAVDPQQILREAERVLIPEGRVLITGFNPWSLWGLWRVALRWQGQVPWCGHFLSYRRVADWLGVLGFDVEYTDVGAFLPPPGGRGGGRLSALGRRAWPMFAGVYALRAVKRVATVTPVRLRWRPLRALSPRGVMEPSARREGDER